MDQQTLDVLDEQQTKAQYNKGLAGSASVCLAAIPVATIDATASATPARRSVGQNAASSSVLTSRTRASTPLARACSNSSWSNSERRTWNA